MFEKKPVMRFVRVSSTGDLSARPIDILKSDKGQKAYDRDRQAIIISPDSVAPAEDQNALETTE